MWVGVAVLAAAIGGGLAWWIYTPSLGVKAQLEIDLAMQHMARWAGDRGGVFPTQAQLAQATTGALDPAVDPWRRPYRYERVAPKGPVRLWSVEANGTDEQGLGDDIASWTR